MVKAFNVSEMLVSQPTTVQCHYGGREKRGRERGWSQ